ncbi:hypothetical protein L218DRAFT_442819 [Marasmius fiardii PR-910]|nr:hypothetical protein L218DRAFT_442819 [Marasmius fiardii PR-910]
MHYALKVPIDNALMNRYRRGDYYSQATAASLGCGTSSSFVENRDRRRAEKKASTLRNQAKTPHAYIYRGGARRENTFVPRFQGSLRMNFDNPQCTLPPGPKTSQHDTGKIAPTNDDINHAHESRSRPETPHFGRCIGASFTSNPVHTLQLFEK